jgi:phage terminase large subunit
MAMNSTEVNQLNSSESENLVTFTFNKLGIDKKATGITDNNYPSKIKAIKQAGWHYFRSIGGKWKNVDRIAKISDLNVYYTNTSKNIEYEQFNYCYAKDKFGNTLEEPIDANDHTINAIEYIVQDLCALGVIKK